MVDRPMQMTPEVGHRRQPLLPESKRRFAEVAGGTAAGCAALCCCPCGLVSLVVLAAVRLPAGLCRRALRRKKIGLRGKKKSGLLRERERDDSVLPRVHPAPSESASSRSLPHVSPATDDESHMDDEMLGKLYIGFWRNPSERE